MEARDIDDALQSDLEAELAAELETELRMVRDAILLVAEGASRRVVVANLRHGRVIEAAARVIADEYGIGLRTLATSDPRRLDLAAEEVAVSPAIAREAPANRSEPVPPRIGRAAASA